MWLLIALFIIILFWTRGVLTKLVLFFLLFSLPLGYSAIIIALVIILQAVSRAK